MNQHQLHLKRGLTGLVVVLASVAMAACTTTGSQKKKPKPPPPPPPGSDMSSQPWARPEKDWEGGRPAFLPNQD